jgi:hypothetical protein
LLRRLLDSINKQALRYRYYAYRESAEFVAAAVDDNRCLFATVSREDLDAARRVTEPRSGP